MIGIIVSVASQTKTSRCFADWNPTRYSGPRACLSRAQSYIGAVVGSSGKLQVTDNITVLPLPSKVPELSPVENIWQFLRDNRLSNRVLKSYQQILALFCHAWNKLINQPWTIMSIGNRKRAHGF